MAVHDVATSHSRMIWVENYSLMHTPPLAPNRQIDWEVFIADWVGTMREGNSQHTVLFEAFIRTQHNHLLKNLSTLLPVSSRQTQRLLFHFRNLTLVRACQI